MGTAKKAAFNSRGGVSGAFQFHNWRGFKIERQLFHCLFVCGFVTVLLSRKPLLDRLVLMLAESEKMRLEDAARGVPVQRTKRDECPTVPHVVRKK